MGRHRGRQLTLEDYHGVPAGWRAEEIAATHAGLSGTFPITAIELGRWSAPAWMPDREAWLRHMAILNRVAEGVRAGDAACVELAIRYIELQHIGSYSGYRRAKLARSLKHAAMTEPQRSRLNALFLRHVRDRDYTIEVRDYWPVWHRIVDTPTADAIAALLAARASSRYTGHLTALLESYRRRMRA